MISLSGYAAYCNSSNIDGSNFHLVIVLILVVCFNDALCVLNKSFCQSSLSSTPVVIFYR